MVEFRTWLQKWIRPLNFPLLAARWLAISILLTIVTVIGHEVAHYVGAVLSGAQNVSLHWADVTFDDNSIGNIGTAVTWLAGPAFTHALILWVLLRKSSNIWFLALGLSACSRNLVLIPFAIKWLIGRDTSSFTNDEVTAAAALGVTPIFFALFAALLGIVGMIVILRRAHRRAPIALPLALFVGTILGIVLWGFAGPVVLPGGKGIG